MMPIPIWDVSRRCSRPGDIASVAFEQAQTQAKNAQIAYDSAKLNYDYQVEFANVTAPISGKVETCNIEVHDNVASQVLLARDFRRWQ